MNATEKKIAAAVRQYFKDTNVLPERIQSLGNRAYRDLVGGPLIYDCEDCGSDETCECNDKWPGFESALREVKDWLSEWGTLYYEIDSEFISEKEPPQAGYFIDGYPCDEDTYGAEWCDQEPHYRLSPKDIAGYLFGRELSQYL